ncbi:MAG: type II toxin-antitoxin system RelE/ParE family toxin [Proteobacteria bacterium]|nr:type II toxin-antitoxin system RelE/ParE family toxin [Pseudomonadota bacterium]
MEKQKEKDIIWVGSSLEDLKQFPKLASQAMGYNLNLVQNGQTPDDWKPMTIIGRGVRELRVHLQSEYRTIYVATRKDAVYVLHCFV